MPDVWDLAVIGGGPAGSAAAWTAARRGLRVVICERGGWPHDRVCGEFISPEALPLLRAMAPELAPAASLSNAWFISPHGRRSGFRLPQPAVALSRRRLDQSLWEAAGAAGAELRARTPVLGVEGHMGDFWFQLGGGEILRARCAIVAAGRWWRLRGLKDCPASENGRGAWWGVKAHLRLPQSPDGIELYGFPGGYCGMAEVEDGSINVCCLLRLRHAGAPVRSDFAPWLCALAPGTALAQRLCRAQQETATVVTVPATPGRRRAAVNPGMLLAGDAAGFLDPFAGDGIARALLSGHMAAQCMAEGDSGRYAPQWTRAATSGFRAAAALRRLVTAPAPIQDAAAGVLANSWLGPLLLRLTRWRTV